jgi:RNA polymerase sigma-70 factor (ECF subfamily)
MSSGTPRPDQGRGKWLSDLYQANAGAVHAYCRRFLNSAEDAADATHEVFLRAISSLDAPPESRQARSWLMTVAQNYCLDLLRRRRRMQSALNTLAADASQQDLSESAVINRQLLNAVLAQLGERERQALWQSGVERRSVGEIASYLGLSYMATAQLLHRARKHAALVAAKLAALIGLAEASTRRRRSAILNFGQSLAAMTIVPLVVVAIATPSSTAHGAGMPRVIPGHAEVSAVQATSATANGGQAVSGGSLLDIGSALGLRKAVGQPVRSTVHSALGTVNQTVRQLTSPPPLPPAPKILPTPVLTPPALPTPPLPKRAL